MKTLLYMLLCCFLLSACTSSGGYSAQKSIHEIAQSDFRVQKFHTSTFTLYGLLRPARNGNTSLHVYIEGDGYSWVNRNRPSTNPTPTDNVTQNLAKRDPSDAAILYLARPCQYVKEGDLRMCSQKFWTSHRLAPEVIIALNEAVNKAKAISQAQHISLVGFSGGGGAAALVAAKRNDVKFLGSVAGLLDHAKWTSMHNISPLKGSLNPADSAHLLKSIPQLHLTGGNDEIVSKYSQDRFCTEIEQTNACQEISGVGHQSNWSSVWNYNIMP